MAVMRIGRSRVRPPSIERVACRVAVGPQLLDEVEQHDRVGHDDADEHQEADERAESDRPVRDEQRREGTDGRERQAEQDDERRDQRVEGEHHHQVDEQDRDAHRGEQPAEGLVLLRGHAARGRPGRSVGSCRRPRRSSMTPWTATDVAPVSSLVISAVIVADGASSIRVIRALDVDLVDVGDRAERHLDRGPDRQLAQGLERGHAAQGRRGPRGRPDRASSSWTRPMGLRRERVADLAADLGRGRARQRWPWSGRPGPGPPARP